MIVAPVSSKSLHDALATKAIGAHRLRLDQKLIELETILPIR